MFKHQITNKPKQKDQNKAKTRKSATISTQLVSKKCGTNKLTKAKEENI